MKNKIKKLLALGLCLTLGFSGCGMTKGETVPYALVTDGTAIIESKNLISAQEAMERYAKEKGERYQAYIPAVNEKEAIEAAFRQAVAAGAKRIVIEGSPLMNEVLYEMQREYRNIRFLCLDGKPVNELGEVEFRGNTVSLDVEASEAGYLAGYAAVAAGFTNLGYLCGADTREADNYGIGYIRGAEDACRILGIGSGIVRVQYWKMGTDVVDPSMRDKLMNWYHSGCQVIFTDGGNYDNVLLAAAQLTAGIIIGNGNSEIGNNLQMYVEKNFGEMVYKELGEMAGFHFCGGKVVAEGADLNAVKMDWNASLITSLDQDTIDEACDSMRESGFSIDTGKGLTGGNYTYVSVSEYTP